MEALQVQAMLESNGIEAVLIGDTRFPNIPEAVRVAKEDARPRAATQYGCSGRRSGGGAGGGDGWGNATAYNLG